MTAQTSFAPKHLFEYGATGEDVRRGIRNGTVKGSTSGLAPGYVQGNLAILPAEYAEEFLRFCQANPKPCPLIGVSEPGATTIPSLGKDLDLRTDTPKYRIFEDGVCVAEAADVRDHWRDDLVTFVLGCSYSFEEPLRAAGLNIHHIDNNLHVPVFRTNIDTTPAGRFSGKMVVSMRSFTPADAIRAIQITTRYPGVHGAPVHIGLPEEIGIADINKPDFGDVNPVLPGELPVFWACGVTPQSVIEQAKPKFAITHAAGHMLVTDRKNSEFALL